MKNRGRTHRIHHPFHCIGTNLRKQIYQQKRFLRLSEYFHFCHSEPDTECPFRIDPLPKDLVHLGFVQKFRYHPKEIASKYHHLKDLWYQLGNILPHCKPNRFSLKCKDMSFTVHQWSTKILDRQQSQDRNHNEFRLLQRKKGSTCSYQILIFRLVSLLREST